MCYIQFWIHFTIYFTLLGSLLIGVWPENDPALLRIKDKFHQPTPGIRPVQLGTREHTEIIWRSFFLFCFVVFLGGFLGFFERENLNRNNLFRLFPGHIEIGLIVKERTLELIMQILNALNNAPENRRTCSANFLFASLVDIHQTYCSIKMCKSENRPNVWYLSNSH